MIVFGSSRSRKSLSELCRTLIRSRDLAMLGLRLDLVCSAVARSSLAVCYSASVQHAFAALRSGGAFCAADLARASRFLRSTTTWRRRGGRAIYFSILIGVLLLLQRRNQLSPVTAFLGMGLAGLVSAAFLLVRLGFHWRHTHDGLTLRAVTEDHWRYGKWAMASAVVDNGFPDNIYHLFFPRFRAREELALRL